MKLAERIYFDEAGEYYKIDEAVQQFDTQSWRDGGWEKFRYE